jgi:purine-binding chemotaxis protein CheW
MNIAEGDIEDTPDFGDGSSTPFLMGLAKVKGKVKILLDIDQVLASADLHQLERVMPV